MKNKFEIRGCSTAIFAKFRRKIAMEVLIDTDDLLLVSSIPWGWYIIREPYDANIDAKNVTFYAKTCFPKVNGKRVKSDVRMHNLIVPHEGKSVDHKDNDGLNNRRNNLRRTNQVINGLNRRGANKNSKSGVRGVSWDSDRQRWTAHVTIDGFGQKRPTAAHRKVVSLGRFDSIEEAKSALEKALAWVKE